MGLCFLAPELLNDYITTITPKINIWSLGVLLYWMKFKKYPFWIGRAKN